MNFGFWIKLWCTFVLEPISFSLVCVCFSKTKKNEGIKKISEDFINKKEWKKKGINVCDFKLSLKRLGKFN